LICEFINATVNFEIAVEELKKISYSVEAIGILDTKIKQLKIRVNVLLPKALQRRGLVNELGNIIKIVTGNLFEADDHKFENNFKAMTDNEKELMNKASRQTILTTTTSKLDFKI